MTEIITLESAINKVIEKISGFFTQVDLTSPINTEIDMASQINTTMNLQSKVDMEEV